MRLPFTSFHTDSESGAFHAGDSVRLRMDEDLLTSEFLLSELNHDSIGFIHTVDDDGDVSIAASASSNILFRGSNSGMDTRYIRIDLHVNIETLFTVRVFVTTDISIQHILIHGAIYSV